MLSGESNVVRAARKILSMGPTTLLVKRGEYGVLSFSPNSVFAVPAYPLEEVFDPTGAGDSFAGGMMGYLAASGDVLRRNTDLDYPVVSTKCRAERAESARRQQASFPRG